MPTYLPLVLSLLLAAAPHTDGWALYRAGEFEAAAKAFREALDADPRSIDAQNGLAYATLQLGDPETAAWRFQEVLEASPEDRDALRGLRLAATRLPDETDIQKAALRAAKRELALDPDDRDAALDLLAFQRRLGEGVGEIRRRPDAPASRPLRVPARAGDRHLEILGDDGAYRPIFVKGINLGAALPGSFPSEFPTDVATYRAWLDTMGALGANAVRLYTLLPPEFYRALAQHNAAAGARKLHLIQGVWTELPDRHDFSDPKFVSEFDDEIARVIDAIHGDLVLAPRPGHAAGYYDADVSGSLLAYIVGREWEPYAVVDYDAMRPGPCSWSGTWFTTSGGKAMECFVTERLDFAAGYEARRYRSLHPLTFANWPTLDPLRHPTESSRDEEDAWKKQYGIPFPEALKEQPWNNDEVSLDATLVHPTESMAAGLFAAYHVYPNYPDFINNDPAYAATGDRYAAYLRALSAHHGKQPLLVAEFGMSTSRTAAHVEPTGRDHGGLDEREAGRDVADMIRTIRELDLAGGIVFSFQDEWFKGTWSVAPFEIPAERRRMWWNAESPEQAYGIVANRPDAPVRLDGSTADWPAGAQVLSDAGYVYLRIETGAPVAWSRTGYRIGIDTYDRSRGERLLPDAADVPLASGAEFAVVLDGPGKSEVLVTPPYATEPRRDRGPFASPKEPTGYWAPIELETNRARIARDGTRIPAIRIDRGKLRFGSLDPHAPSYHTRTDVAVGATAIEIRLPWALLSVTDPSSLRVLHQESAHDPPFDTVATDGFRITILKLDRETKKAAPTIPTPLPFAWRGWETPRYKSEAKDGASAVREAFEAILDGPTPRGSASKSEGADAL